MTHRDTAELALRNEAIAWGTPAESLTQRELTLTEIRKMKPKEYLWHCHYNSKNVDAAIDKPQQVIASKAEAARLKAKEQWAGDIYDEASILEIQRFRSLYPQFDGMNVHDREAILDYLKQNDMLVTLPNLVQAFIKLTLAGTLTLLPERINPKWDAEVTGYKLQHHPHLSELLRPVQQISEAEQIRRMSSKEYAELHPEVLEDAVPQRVVDDIKRAVNSFMKDTPQLEPSSETREILLNYLRGNSIPVTYGNLRLAFQACYQQLKDANVIYSEEHPRPEPEIANRPVRIAEPTTAKRFSRSDIINMSRSEYEENIQRYGNAFTEAVDEAFSS